MSDKIALFDLDRTITVHGTYTPFLLSVTVRRNPLRLLMLPAALIFMLSYKAGVISRDRLKELMLVLLLGPISKASLKPHVERFVKGRLKSGLRPGALAQIEKAREAGQKLVMATASFDFYADEFGRHLEFDVVIATKSTWNDKDKLVARIDGANCYGPHKLVMVKEVFEQQGWSTDDTEFFSDDKSDLPTFEWAGQSFIINPKAKFEKKAKGLGYPILDWA
ncbi:MAG: HAD-IB family hydrolase [Sphingomonadales bacterium]|jgi:HAD superfamily hydrolase (TIGR01490 family)